MRTEQRPEIAELWRSADEKVWDVALAHYWDFVKPENVELEQQLETLDAERLRGMSGEEWYAFLRDEYFRWKYTAPNRYVTTTNALRRYVEAYSVEPLLSIKERLLSAEVMNVRAGLSIATNIPGLGIAGASGLLALIYPKIYGTVDQFCVKALRGIPSLPEREAVNRMNAHSLSRRNGELLVEIMQRQARANTEAFGGAQWTPRMIDKVLWTYGR
jgi:hypothetical protein